MNETVYKEKSLLTHMKVDNWIVVFGVTALVLGFFFFRNFLLSYVNNFPNMMWIPFGVASLCALAFYQMRYDSSYGPVGLIVKGSAIFAVIFLVLEPPALPLVNTDNAGAYHYIMYGWYVALFFSLISAWRFPSFLFPVVIYLFTHKQLYESVTYLQASMFDIRYIVETAMFSILMLYLTMLLDAVKSRGMNASLTHFWSGNRETFVSAVAMAAAGFHLANYFWSGHAKVILDGGPTTWVLENATQNLIITNFEKGTLPFGQWPFITDLTINGFAKIVVAMNAVVLFAQLAALPAVFNRVFLIWLTIFFDLLHLGIYVLGGLFFWPWIANNIIIALVLHRYRDQTGQFVPRILAVIAILIGGFYSLGGAARLGWYDTLDLRKSFVETEMKDGSRIEVPLSYFLSMSYSVSKGRLSAIEEGTQYPQSSWGAIREYQRYRTSGACPSVAELQEISKDAPHVSPEELKLKQEHIKEFMLAHHKMMLDREAKYGHLNFYIRGHHHPSNPLLYKDFNQIRLEDIIRYIIVTESVCLSLDNGELNKKVLVRDEYPIEVKQ